MDNQCPRICPLCGAPVRLLYVNLTEKVLMCEDPNCDYPFGYEELQVVLHESELRENFDLASSVSLGTYNKCATMSAASSIISTSAWAEIERLNRAYDSEECTVDSRISHYSDRTRKRKDRKKKEAEIRNNLENIKKLNTELNLLKHNDGKYNSIEKDKFLNNLMRIQNMSGKQLLKQEEIDKLKKNEADLGTGELKININPVPNGMGVINIEICNENDEKLETSENDIQISLEEIVDQHNNENNETNLLNDLNELEQLNTVLSRDEMGNIAAKNLINKVIFGDEEENLLTEGNELDEFDSKIFDNTLDTSDAIDDINDKSLSENTSEVESSITVSIQNDHSPTVIEQKVMQLAISTASPSMASVNVSTKAPTVSATSSTSSLTSNRTESPKLKPAHKICGRQPIRRLKGINTPETLTKTNINCKNLEHNQDNQPNSPPRIKNIEISKKQCKSDFNSTKEKEFEINETSKQCFEQMKLINDSCNSDDEILITYVSNKRQNTSNDNDENTTESTNSVKEVKRRGRKKGTKNTVKPKLDENHECRRSSRLSNK